MFWLLVGLFALPLLLCEWAVLRNQPLSAWALANVALYPLVTLGSIAVHDLDRLGTTLATRSFCRAQ